jgi:hypothetical protein
MRDGKANSTVAYYLAQTFNCNVSSDGFSLKFPGSVEVEPLRQALGELQQLGAEELKPVAHEHAIRGLKFSSCLYPELAQHV